MKQASSAFPPRGDAATIAAMVASARAAAKVEVVIPRHNARHGDDLWIIEETILLPSGTTVILDGARLVLADGVFCNLFANEHAWTPDRCSAAAEDRDIAIVGRDGALLDGGNYNQWGEQMSPDIGSHAMDGAAAKLAARPRPKPLVHNCPIYFHNVRGFRVEGVTVRHQRYWGMCFSFCSEGAIRRIRFEADISWVSDDGRVHDPSRRPNFYQNLWIKNGDGIDLRKGCHDIRIEGVTGWSEDDTIALTNLCGGEMNDVVEGKCHDICHVSIRDVRTYAWRWMNQVRLLCCDGARIHDVSIAGVRDTSDPAEQPWRMASSIQLNDESSEYFRSRNAAMGELRDISISDVHSRAGNPIRVFGPVENLEIHGVFPMRGAHCALAVQGSAEFRNCRIEGIDCAPDTDIRAVLDFFHAEGDLSVRNVRACAVDHLLRNSGSAKVLFDDVAVGEIRGGGCVSARNGSWYNDPPVEPDPECVDPRFLRTGRPLGEAPYTTPPRRRFRDANGCALADVVRAIAELPPDRIREVAFDTRTLAPGETLRPPADEDWNVLALQVRAPGGDWTDAVLDLVHDTPLPGAAASHAKIAKAAGLSDCRDSLEIQKARLVKGLIYAGGDMPNWYPWIPRWRRAYRARPYGEAVADDIWAQGRLAAPVPAMRSGVADIELVLVADTPQRRETARLLAAELLAALPASDGVATVGAPSDRDNVKIFLGLPGSASCETKKRAAWFRRQARGLPAASYVTSEGRRFYLAGQVGPDGRESETGVRNAALDFIEANLGTIFPLPGDPGVGRVTAVRDFDFTWGHDVWTLPRIAEWRLSRDLRLGALNRAYGTPEAPADIRLERGATLVPDEPPPRTALVEIAPGVRVSYADTVYAPVNDELYRAAFSWAQLVREVRVRENGPDAFPARAEILAFDLGRLRAIGVKSYAIDTPVTAANAPEIWTMLRMVQRSDLAADAVRAYFCRKVFGKDAPDRYRLWAKQRERLITGC